jgi:hypothetical protein
MISATGYEMGKPVPIQENPLNGEVKPSPGRSKPWEIPRTHITWTSMRTASPPAPRRVSLSLREAAVTAQPLAPVIPSSAVPAGRQRARSTAGRPLPLARPMPAPSLPGHVVYGIGRIDASGRIADRTVISALGCRALRGLRAARLARRRPRDQQTDPAVREAIGGLLLRARHGRSGRVPPHEPGPHHHGALSHHHPRVLPPGPGPGHGDRPRPHAPRGRRSSCPRTDGLSRTSGSRAADVVFKRAVREPAQTGSSGPDRRRGPPAGPGRHSAPARRPWPG